MLKVIIPVSDTETSATDEWVTICSCTINVNCSIKIKDIWVIGKKISNGLTATAEGRHRAKRIGGVLSVVGTLVYLVDFGEGSDVGFQSHDMRIIADADELRLQVLPATADAIDWYGAFTAILN